MGGHLHDLNATRTLTVGSSPSGAAGPQQHDDGHADADSSVCSAAWKLLIPTTLSTSPVVAMMQGSLTPLSTMPSLPWASGL